MTTEDWEGGVAGADITTLNTLASSISKTGSGTAKFENVAAFPFLGPPLGGTFETPGGAHSAFATFSYAQQFQPFLKVRLRQEFLGIIAGSEGNLSQGASIIVGPTGTPDFRFQLAGGAYQFFSPSINPSVFKFLDASGNFTNAAGADTGRYVAGQELEFEWDWLSNTTFNIKEGGVAINNTPFSIPNVAPSQWLVGILRGAGKVRYGDTSFVTPPPSAQALVLAQPP